MNEIKQENDLIQDAKALPLGADKCIVERDKVLDMLDEIIAQLPSELKQSRTIVESRNELISQARREAEGILRQAQEQAKQILRDARAKADAMVEEHAIYQESKRRCEEMVLKTQAQMDELKRISSAYVDSSLKEAEEIISKALEDVRMTRSRFAEVAVKRAASAAPSSFDQDLD